MDRDTDAVVSSNRAERRKQRLADLRATAKAGGVRIRTREEILATCDWTIPESLDVLAWGAEPPIGRELA